MTFVFDALFPLVLPGSITARDKRLAGPKALAAQTFKADLVRVEFLESGKWADLGRLFEKQIGLVETPPVLSLPETGRWVAYPYAVDGAYSDGTCAAWVEITPKRTFYRHVRLYHQDSAALAHNQFIAEILAR